MFKETYICFYEIRMIGNFFKSFFQLVLLTTQKEKKLEYETILNQRKFKILGEKLFLTSVAISALCLSKPFSLYENHMTRLAFCIKPNFQLFCLLRKKK